MWQLRAGLKNRISSFVHTTLHWTISGRIIDSDVRFDLFWMSVCVYIVCEATAPVGHQCRLSIVYPSSISSPGDCKQHAARCAVFDQVVSYCSLLHGAARRREAKAHACANRIRWQVAHGWSTLWTRVFHIKCDSCQLNLHCFREPEHHRRSQVGISLS